MLCEKGHLLDIKTTYIIAILKDFVAKHSENNENPKDLNLKQKIMDRKYTISRNISVEDVTNYWTRFREIFSQKDEDLWDVLLIGLNKYINILKERQKIDADIEKLKQQNAELNHLLLTYNSTSGDSKK